MPRFAQDRELCQRAASVASWSRQGITRATLVGPQFARTTYGFYRRAGSEETSAQRILDAVAGLPAGALIAGWAAAYVRGVDALDGLDDHTMARLPVPVLLPPGQRRRSTNGIDYRQTSRHASGRLVGGIPVTTISRTTVDLALRAPDVTEAVVGLDAILGARLLTYPQLQQLAGRLPGRRGVHQARRAMELARVGVASTWESRLRIFAAVELGWPDLKPNRAVFDRHGQLLGVPDLLDVEAGLALEYDGARWRTERTAGHRDRAQHREDNAREERLERAGLVVVRVEKDDLTRFRSRLAERLRGSQVGWDASGPCPRPVDPRRTRVVGRSSCLTRCSTRSRHT